jgi:hypothetical protein
MSDKECLEIGLLYNHFTTVLCVDGMIDGPGNLFNFALARALSIWRWLIKAGIFSGSST